MKPSNAMQERQDRVKCEIIVRGTSKWEDGLSELVQLREPWASMYATKQVPMMTAVEINARSNAQSLERSVVTAFLDMGYVLEELEVEFASEEESKWGKCIWYKDHPAYKKTTEEVNGKKYPIPGVPNFYFAMWKTEHAGDRQFCLYSTQFSLNGSVLLHKTLVYRRVVFSPPQARAEEAKAA